MNLPKRSVALLALAALASACGSTASQREADGSSGTLANGPVVVIAEFTGEVDAERGTFTVAATPTPAARALGVPSLVVAEPGEVSVANSGAPWNGVSGKACGSTVVTGANVVVTLSPAAVTAGITLGGVWAELTQFGGPMATYSCNNVYQPLDGAPPAGLLPTYGLWYFGTLTPGFPSSVTEWDFPVAATSKFVFRGRILATRVAAAPAPANPGQYEFSLGWNGQNVVAADQALPQLDLVAPDGSGAGSVALQDLAQAIASDPVTGFTWYATVLTPVIAGGLPVATYVGYATRAGQTFDTDAATSGAITPWSLAVNPASSNQAWFADYGAGFVASVTRNPVGGAVAIGTPVYLPDPTAGVTGPDTPYGVAFGSDGLLYVTSEYGGLAGTGMVYRLEADLTTWTVLDPGVACRGPRAIVAGPDGKLWIISDAGSGTGLSGAVCTLDAAGVFTAVTQVVSPRGIVAGSDGKIWYSEYASGIVGRIDPADPTAPPYRVSVVSTSPSFLDWPPVTMWLTASPANGATPAYVWVNADTYLLRLTP